MRMPEQAEIDNKEDKDLEEFAGEIEKTTPPEGNTSTKVIDINWDAVPSIFSLRAKMKKALELDLEHIPGESAFLVKNGAEPHTATESTCDCKDWEVNGTSITPCKHMLKVKYPDDQLMQMLEKSDASKIINTKDKTLEKVVETVKEKEIQKAARAEEIAIIETEEEELLMLPDLTLALPEIGKIKIGGFSDRRTRGRRPLPEKWDHFKIGTLMKDEDGGVIIDEEMSKAIGGDKTELDITMCYDEPALNMPTFYAAFTQSKLACMGTGKKAWQRQEDGERKEIACNRKECQLARDKKCTPYGRLSVILEQANRIGGTFVFRTTSWNSLRNITSSMAFIRNQTGGILAGIPLKLKLRSASTIPNGLGRKVTIYIVNLEYAGTMNELKQDARKEINRRQQLGLNMHELEQIQKGEIAEHLKSEIEETAAEISGEFYTEEEVEE